MGRCLWSLVLLSQVLTRSFGHSRYHPGVYAPEVKIKRATRRVFLLSSAVEL